MSEDRLRELARDLAWDRPDRERREAVRTSLLVAAEATPPRRRRGRFAIAAAFAGGAVVAAAVAAVLVRGERAEPELQPRIIAGPAAVFERSIASSGGRTEEVVRVHAGSVHVAAPPASTGFRLQTGDAAVDGVGEYEVDVANDRLARITVRSGTARLIAAGDATPVFLAAGETWRAAVIRDELLSIDRPPETDRVAQPAAGSSAPPPVVREPPRAPAASSRPHAPRPAGSASPTISAASDDIEREVPRIAPVASPVERHFQVGWTLLRAGKPREAAVELGLAANAAETDPLAIDARYFQAIAWIRAGQPRDAEAALRGFLERAPTSLRRGRAAVTLARLIAERGDDRAAREWFESALRDSDPAVAATARAGLDALRSR